MKKIVINMETGETLFVDLLPDEVAEREAGLGGEIGQGHSPIVLFPADLWRRANDDEAERIYDAMSAQPVRLRELFRTAQTYRSDDPLWPLLDGAAKQLFGVSRAAELLAPSI